MRKTICLSLLIAPTFLMAQPVNEPVIDHLFSTTEADIYEGVVNYFGTWQLITYAKNGDLALHGGDIVLGTHAKIQEQNLAKLLSLLSAVDRDGFGGGQIDSFLDEAARLLENPPSFTP